MKKYRLIQDYNTPGRFAARGSLVVYSEATKTYVLEASDQQLVSGKSLISLQIDTIQKGVGVWFEEVKEQRFEITNMEQHQDWNGRRKIIGLRIDSNIEIPTDKLPKVKAAIEGLLNKEKTLFDENDMIKFGGNIANAVSNYLTRPATSKHVDLRNELAVYKEIKKEQCG